MGGRSRRRAARAVRREARRRRQFWREWCAWSQRELTRVRRQRHVPATIPEDEDEDEEWDESPSGIIASITVVIPRK